MTTADEIKQAVLSLPETEYAKVLDWLHELAEDTWDKQIEDDILAERLDFLAADAEQAERDGTRDIGGAVQVPRAESYRKES